VSDFIQSRSGACDLRRAMRLFVSGRTDFLGELINFRDYVRDLAESSIQFFRRDPSPSFTIGGALFHVLDGLGAIPSECFG